jgi:hypothetical protein
MRTRTAPAAQPNPPTASQSSNPESATPCPRCSSFAVQRRAEGNFCLVCGTERVSPSNTDPRGLRSNESKNSAQYRSSAKSNSSAEMISSGRSETSTIADSTQITRYLEGQLAISLKTKIDGECQLIDIGSDGTLVLRLPDHVDRRIESAIMGLQQTGKSLIGRSTWASKKISNERWEPVFVCGWGEPTRQPNVVLAVLSLADFWRGGNAYQSISRRLSLLPPIQSDLYVMPSVVLWDGTLSSRGNLQGYQFRGTLTSAHSLRPVHLNINKMQHVSMAKDPIGSLRITKFEPGFFLQPDAGGEMWF